MLIPLLLLIAATVALFFYCVAVENWPWALVALTLQGLLMIAVWLLLRRVPATGQQQMDITTIIGMIAAITRSQSALAVTVDSRAPRVPPWLTRRFFRHVVSQLYHGEVGSLEVCERLATLIDEPRARRFLNIQIADERRHAALYHDYLEDLGGVSPVDSGL